MDELNYKYIGKDLDEVKSILEKDGFEIEVKSMEPQKDKEILIDEVVVKLTQEGNKITLITSMFKKYIWEIIYIFCIDK